MKSQVSILKRLRGRVAAGSGLLTLHAGRLRLEAESLEGGVFRIRVIRVEQPTLKGPSVGEPQRNSGSWAIVKRPPTDCSSRTRRLGGTVFLTGSHGSLEIKLKTGEIVLKSADATILLRTSAGALRFLDGSPRVTFSLAAGIGCFGLGESTGPLDQRGLVREFWNIDVLGHSPAIHPGLRGLYVSIPFVLLKGPRSSCGVFWDNPGKQTWDLGQTNRNQLKLSADTGEVDLFLFPGPDPCEVVTAFTRLTGFPPMPPLWALGYQQCRYSYESEERVMEIAQCFRTKRIPCDTLYLDIDHMDGYRAFTFGSSFPHPARMLRRLSRLGFKVVAIVDPGVKEDAEYGVFQRGVEERAYVRSGNDGPDLTGEVWPGKARFPDFLNPRVRAWWAREQAAWMRVGIRGIWNDMNEPANFALPSKTLPLDAEHHTDFGNQVHAAVHNAYGLEMARASRDGSLLYDPDRRPFVLTRAGYAGVQRFAAVWTGDNSSCWEHLADSVRMLQNLSLSGVSFCGSDVGGFLDNATPELLVRWLELGVFTPLFRNHSNRGTLPQEPWAFGAEVERLGRRYLELRYRLLPYLYGLFAEASRSGTPVLRPLFWHYPTCLASGGCSDAFLLGRDLLVAPITQQGATARSVFLPEGVWFDFWTGARLEGGRHVVALAPLNIIPVFSRGGGVVPMGPVQQFVGDVKSDCLEVHLWPEGKGQFLCHEDDGVSLKHAAGESSSCLIETNSTEAGGSVIVNPRSGEFRSRYKTLRLVFRGAWNHGLRIQMNGREVPSQFVKRNRSVIVETPWRDDGSSIVIHWLRS